MGRQVLLAVIYCLTLSQALGKAENKSISANTKDDGGITSVLHRPARGAVYASGVPHYTLGPAIFAASSQHFPVKTSSLNSGLISLKDSYGKYVHMHPSMYKPSYPQQFVPLQDLPPHLAQPLVSAASPSFKFNDSPHFFYGPQSYKIQEVQLPESQAYRFGSISQPLVYANDLKSFAQNPVESHQKVNNEHFSVQKAKYVSEQPYQTYQQESPKEQLQLSDKKVQQLIQEAAQNLRKKPTEQELRSFSKDAKDQATYQKTREIQALPAQTSITAIVNGKKTVINLETKPPLPLLDLNLLEPLKFDNPLVPQLQHYLPKVKGATYHKLPALVPKKVKNHKEYVITKTKSYDSGSSKAKTYSEPKQQNRPRPSNKPTKTGITVKGYPNSGDYSYEINTPNHKETYNEQVIQYNKQTNMKPMEYSYNENKKEEPVVYSYVHNSKEPLKITHVEYNSENGGAPKQIVYHNSPQNEEYNSEDDGVPKQIVYHNSKQNEEITDTSDESSSQEENDSREDDSPSSAEEHSSPAKEQHHHSDYQSESPKNPPHQHQQEQIIYGTPAKNQHYNTQDHSKLLKHPPQSQYYVKSEAASPKHGQYHSESPQHSPQSNNHHVKSKTESIPTQNPKSSYYTHSQGSQKPRVQGDSHVNSPNDKGQLRPLIYYEGSVPSSLLKAEHRGQEITNKPHHNLEPKPEVQNFAEPHNQYQTKGFAEPVDLYQAITPEYEEDIRILPTHKPHAAAIKVDPSQHLRGRPTAQTFSENHNEQQGKHIHPQHIMEKSKHIIIQETQETPDDRDDAMRPDELISKMLSEMSDRGADSEEDFEKGYKESAVGFPAYEDETSVEKDVFDPDSYGTSPPYHDKISQYDGEGTPFLGFQKEGDQFPKFARLAYKDARDNNQEDYFLEYGVHKPESYTDRVKSKVDYYKMFKANRPKEVKSAKFTIAPSFDFFSVSPPKQKQSKYVQYKSDPPILYEYSKDKQDNNAYASIPSSKKYKTHFVAPQLQYGFEPVIMPQLFAESELAALASNHSPKSDSDSPGTRKKMYSEKFYMKKTSTNSKPSQSNS